MLDFKYHFTKNKIINRITILSFMGLLFVFISLKYFYVPFIIIFIFFFIVFSYMAFVTKKTIKKSVYFNIAFFSF